MQEQQKNCFQLGQFEIGQPEEGKKKRTFSGVAYSGEPIIDHWYWERVIFDLDSMQIKGRIPALLEHNPKQRAGAINSHSISHDQGLVISGDLMSNEFGTQVAQDSDDGFPWQMSVRIEPGKIEEIPVNQQVTVNGKTYQGPITVFRDGRIREVSFCALGADDNTNAVAASHNPTQQPKEDTDVTELEQAKEALKQAEKARDDALAELNKFKADKRAEDIEALQKELNTTFSADDVKAYTEMDDTAFAFTSKQLRQFSSKPAPTPAPSVNPNLSHLFQHQATGGDGQQSDQGGEHRFSAGIKKLQAMKAGK